MNDLNLEQELNKIAALAEQIKQSLFKCAQLSVSGDSANNWQRAEALFNLAKEADVLRSKILETNESKSFPSNNAPSQSTSTEKTPPKKPKTTRRKKKDYPKFVVHGDSLFKIGLRRNGKDEYTQNVPKAVYDKVVSRLIVISKSQIEFTADDVIQAVDCPDYQAYIVLAVLRNHGLLEIPRRGYHKFVTQNSLELDAANLWDNLLSPENGKNLLNQSRVALLG